MRIFFFVLAATICFASCKGKKDKPGPEPVDPILPKDTTQTTGITVDPANDTVLLRLTSEAMQAFRKKDYIALAAMVHPDSGVRFSPYSYIDSTSDKIVTADWIRNQARKQEKILWGSADATGDDIKLTFDKYIDGYVYDVDFIKPENLKVNQVIGAGTTANNLKEMYPTCNFTESHFSGFDKKYEGMDWRSLRLVFKMKDGKYYLIGVVHDEWTT
jgi:hypothetical protein